MEEIHQQMPSVNMAYYINTKTIEAVRSALDIPLGQGVGMEGGGRGGEGDSGGEDVEERF